MNKFRNEHEIELAGEKILLRPTFENMAAMEQAVGSLLYLAVKFSGGLKKGGQIERSMPSMTECAQIIYHCQAEKKLTLEETFDACMDHGLSVTRPVLEFLTKCSAGNKHQQDLTPDEKKS